MFDEIVTSANVASTADCTTQSLLQTMRRIQKQLDLLPKPDHDVVLMTEVVYQQFKKCLGKDLPWVQTTIFDSFMGIPLEVYPTPPEVWMRAVELVREGKRPMVCVIGDTDNKPVGLNGH